MAACAPRTTLGKSDAPVQTPGTVRTQGFLTTQDGRLVEYRILIPQNWEDKYETRKEGAIAYYDYIASPKQTLFSIEALTAEQWKEKQQEPGYGEELFRQDEIVFVYHVALDNPYTGSQAEEFQQMAGEVKNVVSSLTVSIVTDPDEMGEAGKALTDFFYGLSTGDYAAATKLYGGSYESLMEMNPDVDPTDHAALLENACTINGFQCLAVKQVVGGRQEWPDTFVFTLEFSAPDGSLFEMRPCCGEAQENEKPQSRFDFTVVRTPQMGNTFLVQDLPVYVP